MNTNQIIETYLIKAIRYGEIYDVKPSLILAIIEQESSGDPTALGTSGEIGLGQLTRFALLDYNRATGNNIVKTDLFNIDININILTFYISNLHRNFFPKSMFQSLRAYNAGIGRVRENDEISVDYAKSVLSRQEKIVDVLTKQI